MLASDYSSYYESSRVFEKKIESGQEGRREKGKEREEEKKEEEEEEERYLHLGRATVTSLVLERLGEVMELLGISRVATM